MVEREVGRFATTPPPAGWEPFLQMIASLTGATGALLRAWDMQTASVAFVAAVGLDREAIAQERETPLCGVCLEAIDRDQICTTSDNCLLAHRDSSPFLSPQQGEPTLVSVPLDHQGKPIGVLNLFFCNQRPTDPLLQILRPLGLLLALTLENERLKEEQVRTWNIRLQHLVAGELHDGLAQQLSYARMALRVANNAFAERLNPTEARSSSPPSEWSALLERYREVEQLIASLHQEVRHLIRSFACDDAAHHVLTWSQLFAEFRAHNPECTLEVAIDPEALPSTTFITEQLARIIQEALNNIEKHAHATHVSVTLSRHHDQVVLTIEDNGQGFEPEVTSSHSSAFGLRLMANRVALLGGTWHVASVPEKGTKIEVAIPLPHLRASHE